MTSVETQKYYEKWIPDKGIREQGFDCFISYRWTDEKWGEQVRGANGDDSMMHTHAQWTRNLFSTVDTKAMFCLEKAEAEGKSKVMQV
jgi:hypothetical protein